MLDPRICEIIEYYIAKDAKVTLQQSIRTTLFSGFVFRIGDIEVCVSRAATIPTQFIRYLAKIKSSRFIPQRLYAHYILGNCKVYLQNNTNIGFADIYANMLRKTPRPYKTRISKYFIECSGKMFGSCERMIKIKIS